MTIPKNVVVSARGVTHPTYIYDLGILRERLALLEKIPVRRKRVHFATMANDHPLILAEIAAAGHGAFVNSLAHLDLAQAAGFAPQRIIYAASNMTRVEIERCLHDGVHLVVDSIGQLSAVDELAQPGMGVGIRVNVGSALDVPEIAFDPNYRFGILPNELPEMLRCASRTRIRGIHAYFGTDLRDPNVLIEGLRRLGTVGADLPHLTYIDGGGGFGVADDPSEPNFNLDAYGEGARKVMETVERHAGRPLELVIEPGRWLVAPIAWFLTRVVDVKRRTDRIFAGTSASVAQFPRMLLHPEKAHHACEILEADARKSCDRPVWLCGNSTYSRDFLARGAALPEPRPGDLIAFHNAGAYCRSMLTRFLGKDAPDEIVLNASATRPGALTQWNLQAAE